MMYEDDPCTCTLTFFGQENDMYIDYDQSCPIHGEN